jgi:hypothetical protein
MMTKHIPAEHEIETFSGKFVDLSDPSPDSITMEDIGHALSQTCRYGGHCRRYYSVAEHSVFVSKRLERRGASRALQLAGLHHDDAEAYLGDIPRPLKPLLGPTYKIMTDAVDEAIVMALDLERHNVVPFDFHHPEVKGADNWALFVEARKLLPSQGRQWWDGGQGSDQWALGDLPSRIVIPDYWKGGLQPAEAKDLYIARHMELTSG